LPTLRVLRKVQSRNLRHVLILPFSLFFLQFEGDTADWTTLDTFHQVSGVAGDLQGPEEYQLAACTNFPITSNCVELTLLRSRFDAMMAISSQILLLVSKSRVSFG